LLPRKIIKIVATRCQILRLKYTKFDFGLGLPQNPLGELTGLELKGRGPNSKVSEWEGGIDGRKGTEKKGEGR